MKFINIQDPSDREGNARKIADAIADSIPANLGIVDDVDSLANDKDYLTFTSEVANRINDLIDLVDRHAERYGAGILISAVTATDRSSHIGSVCGRATNTMVPVLCQQLIDHSALRQPLLVAALQTLTSEIMSHFEDVDSTNDN